MKRFAEYDRGIHEHFLGDYMLVEEHLAVVQRLEERVRELESDLNWHRKQARKINWCD